MPEVFQEVDIVNFPCDMEIREMLREAANPAKVLCNNEIICVGVGIKESTTCADKLDVDSLQIAEVGSIRCRFTV